MATLRPARAAEAAALSALALRSKGHWGYSAEFLQACRAELTYTAQECDSGLLVVAEQRSGPAGFYLLDAGAQAGELGQSVGELVGELRALFVDPEVIGTGLGKELLLAALRHARNLGRTALRLDADPGAASFYSRYGARRIGSSPSGSIPGRVLARMEFDLTGPAQESTG